MCWIKDRRDPRRIILHLREYSYQPWKPYNSSSYSVPDYRIPNGSKGWATFQHLRAIGWTLVPTAQANSSSSAIPFNTANKAA